jgi:deoxyhypusine synthase
VGWHRVSRSRFLTTPLEAIEMRPRTVSNLLEAMGKTGFQGRSLARAASVLQHMAADPDTLILLGYAGSLSTTGQWRIVQWLIERRFVDVVVSTGANVTEDVFEGLGFSYFQGSHNVDDDALLAEQIDRYHDVYADELEYRRLEEFLGAFMASVEGSRSYSSAEFLHRFGLYQSERGMDSITAAAARAGVPVFAPALFDSGFGVAAYTHNRISARRPVVDQVEDFVQLGRIGEQAKSTSVIYLGGGVPKDTIQLMAVMQTLAHGGSTAVPHRHAIQITTDSPQWGGLSGCTFEEAVSWGKIDADGEHAVCYCDATIALPIIAQALLESGVERAVPADFGWLFGAS